jgi:hypothetical protein
MDNKEIKLAENVILIDVAFLNVVIINTKNYFESKLKRELNNIDVAELSDYLALDMGLQPGENKCMMVLVYDTDSAMLAYSSPAGIQKDLDGMAFHGQLGEFSYFGVPTKELVSREDLFMNMLDIINDTKEVKRLGVLSFNEEYGNRVKSVLNKMKEKEVVQFRMNEPEKQIQYRWNMLAFPLMQALGIKGSEL